MGELTSERLLGSVRELKLGEGVLGAPPTPLVMLGLGVEARVAASMI